MSLINDAKAAHKHGVTYGVYMATIKKPEPPKPKVKRACANCGDPLIGGRMKFCCNECREKFKTKERMGDKYV